LTILPSLSAQSNSQLESKCAFGILSEMAVSRRTFWLLIGAILFALAHTQSPLYWSNQNQYFLHGLAQAGVGFLDQDWLANTADPTPVFSAFVHVVYRFAHESIYHVAYALILGVYFISLMSLAAVVPHGPRSPLGQLRLGVGLIAVHAAIARWASVQLVGVDCPWFLQAGVAGQYVLGPGLQPSVFGIFLIAAISAFAHDRLALTVICTAFACTFHPTYLLHAALLTLGFLHVLWWSNRRRACVFFGVAIVLAVLPIAAYSIIRFRPTSLEMFSLAQQILVDFRIPHHTLVSQWLDWIAVAQMLWIAQAIVMMRNSRLFPVLLTAYSGSLLLSAAQVFTMNRTLALIFPWRMTAVLMPVATTIMLSRAITWFHPNDAEESGEPLRLNRPAPIVLGILVVAITGLSIWVPATGRAYYSPSNEEALYSFVREHKQAGDVFLLPVSIPILADGERGSRSSTFVVERDDDDPTLIPIDLQRFRLTTGAPIYVDFKSIPYKDEEVIAWRLRLQQSGWWRTRTEAASLRQYSITHVVTPADRELDPADFDRVYADASYRVYRVVPK
jgi:hypothetical protein